MTCKARLSCILSTDFRGAIQLNSSARHVFEVMRRVCHSGRPISAAEIHRLLKLPASTIHRALATLEQEGFISRHRSLSHYGIGPSPQHLAHALYGLFPMRRAFHDLLQGVATARKQTVILTMRLGWYGLKVAVFEGTNDVFHAGALGEMRLLTDDVAGQCMLEVMDDTEIGRMNDFLERHWPDSANRPTSDRLTETIATFRVGGRVVEPFVDEAGWAWEHFPIVDAAARVIAALSGGMPGDARDMTSSQSSTNLATAVARIAARLRLEPELAWSPFGHLGPDEILLQRNSASR